MELGLSDIYYGTFSHIIMQLIFQYTNITHTVFLFREYNPKTLMINTWCLWAIKKSQKLFTDKRHSTIFIRIKIKTY